LGFFYAEECRKLAFVNE